MTTTLNCPWMQNQYGQNPCAVAEAVGQLCDPGYTVSLTNFQEANYIPNATTANNCTCCWSIYNLLSACSYCVQQYQYTNWNAWTNDCGDHESNSYLPLGLGLTTSDAIPFWATKNSSDWYNGVFNVTQAKNLADEDQADATGGPLPTMTSITSPSTPSAPVGVIVGGVIGGIVIVVVGGLIAFWVMCRHRSQRTNNRPIGVRFFNNSPSIVQVAPSIRSGAPVQSTRDLHTPPASIRGYPLSIHSGTTHAQTSLISPVSSGFSPRGQSVALPFVDDAAEMITPFLTTSSGHRGPKSDGSASIKSSRSIDALSERVVAPTGQRARLNPPPYSAGSSGETSTPGRRVSARKQKRRNGSVSAATTYSEHSRASTTESVQTASQRERSRSRAVSPNTGQGDRTESALGATYGINGGGIVETATHSKRAGGSSRRPPVV